MNVSNSLIPSVWLTYVTELIKAELLAAPPRSQLSTSLGVNFYIAASINMRRKCKIGLWFCTKCPVRWQYQYYVFSLNTCANNVWLVWRWSSGRKPKSNRIISFLPIIIDIRPLYKQIMEQIFMRSFRERLCPLRNWSGFKKNSFLKEI